MFWIPHHVCKLFTALGTSELRVVLLAPIVHFLLGLFLALKLCVRNAHLLVLDMVHQVRKACPALPTVVGPSLLLFWCWLKDQEWRWSRFWKKSRTFAFSLSSADLGTSPAGSESRRAFFERGKRLKITQVRNRVIHIFQFVVQVLLFCESLKTLGLLGSGFETV